MDVINKGIPALFVLAMLTVFGNSFGQNRTSAPGSQRAQFYFDKPVTLDSLTRYIHGHSKIRFSFNSTKVKGTQLITLKKGAYSIEQLLQEIRRNTSLYYSMYNGYVIFQDNPPKPKTTTPPVAKTNNTKPPAHTANKKTNTAKPVIKPQPVVQARKVNTTKIPADTLKVDSVLVFLPRDTTSRQQTIPAKPQDEAEDISDFTTETKNRLKLPHFQLGVVPVDTTKRDTLQKKDTPAITQPPVTPVTAKKKKRTTDASSGTRVYYDNAGNDWSWQYGLQWKGTLPLYDSKNYFTGANAGSQPYTLLIPGAWLSATLNNRHELMLLIKPAEWYFFNKKDFRRDSNTTLIPRGDSIIRYDTVRGRTSNRLLKTSGWYGSLQYNYHINNHLMIGAGVGYHLQVQGLTYKQTYKMPGDSLVRDSLYSMKNDTITSKYLASSFVTAKLEIAYRYKALDLGATLLLPLTDPFTEKSLNKSRPVNLQLFLRWRIKRNDDE